MNKLRNDRLHRSCEQGTAGWLDFMWYISVREALVLTCKKSKFQLSKFEDLLDLPESGSILS